MSKPNGFWPVEAKSGKTKFVYDGTTKGLTRSAYERGLRAGAKITTGIGNFILIDAAHDSRAYGLWADEIRG